MLVLAFTLLLAAPGDVAAQLRHLQAAASAQSPAPAPDGVRLAFVTTLFGSRQVASMGVGGSYPFQLTDEPSGVVAVRYAPNDARTLVATALREGRRRLVFLDEEGSPPKDLDPSPGEQIFGGFTRDGKRLLYATVSEGRTTLSFLPMDTRKAAAIAPPPPAAGLPPTPHGQTIEEGLSGLLEISPPSPDSRTALAVVRRGDGEALVLVDLIGARAQVLLKADGRARYRWPRYTADNKSLTVLTNAGRATMGVESIAVQGGAKKPLFVARNDIESYALSDDGHRLAVAISQNGETIFSLLDNPSLRAQPLPQPPAGALAPGGAGEPTMVWNKAGDRLFFAWQQADDTTDVWSFRIGYGTAQRHTRSPRPGLPRGTLVRPTPVKGVTPEGNELQGWLWRPRDIEKPRVAVLASRAEVRPVFDKRIAALNAAGVAVLAFNGPGAQAAALRYVRESTDLDPSRQILLDFDGATIDDPTKWSGIVAPPSVHKGGLDLDATDPDLTALVKFATRPGSG